MTLLPAQRTMGSARERLSFTATTLLKSCTVGRGFDVLQVPWISPMGLQMVLFIKPYLFGVLLKHYGKVILQS